LNKLFGHRVKAQHFTFAHEDEQLFIGVWVCKLEARNGVASARRHYMIGDDDLLGDCALESIPKADHIVN